MDELLKLRTRVLSDISAASDRLPPLGYTKVPANAAVMKADLMNSAARAFRVLEMIYRAEQEGE